MIRAFLFFIFLSVCESFLLGPSKVPLTPVAYDDIFPDRLQSGFGIFWPCPPLSSMSYRVPTTINQARTLWGHLPKGTPNIYIGLMEREMGCKRSLLNENRRIKRLREAWERKQRLDEMDLGISAKLNAIFDDE
jgi:hypothetical protein